jgi:hypothetical protein
MQQELHVDTRTREFIRRACATMESMLAHSGCELHPMFAETTKMILRAFDFDSRRDRRRFLRRILLLVGGIGPGEFHEAAHHGATYSESSEDSLTNSDGDEDSISVEDSATDCAMRFEIW